MTRERYKEKKKTRKESNRRKWKAKSQNQEGKGRGWQMISIYYKNISWSPALGLDCVDSGYVI